MAGTTLVDFLLFIIGMLGIACIILSMLAYNQANLIKLLKRANSQLANEVMAERRKHASTSPPAHIKPRGRPRLVHSKLDPTEGVE